MTATAAWGETLLVNPSAEGAFLSGWTIHAGAPSSGWDVRAGGIDGCRRFVTSYEWCIRSQEIDLVARGASPEALDAAPAVAVSEWFAGADPDPNDYAYLKVELRDAGHVAFATFDTGVFRTRGGWLQISHRFTDYGPGLRYIYWEDGGKDTEEWAGQFGASLDAASCELELPFPRPHLLVSPPAIDFGTQGTGDGPTPAEVIVISNTGAADLAFNVCLSGALFADFAIVSGPATRRLSPGQSAFVAVVFDPTLDGEKLAWLRVWSDDPEATLVELPLAGTAVETPAPTLSYFEIFDFATLWYSENPFAYDLIPDGRLDERDLLEILKAW